MVEGKKTAAIVLAAGKGTRMGSAVHKQYLELGGRPLIYYALKAFEESCADRIILVAGSGECGYCRTEIVEKYGFRKVAAITEGGQERYHSVFEGLKAAEGSDIVLIHDGARPCVTKKVIDEAAMGAVRYGACVIGMPVKDTIKVADDEEFAGMTPDRSRLWQIQTPQAFDYRLVLGAYEKLLSDPKYQRGVTDDAMVVESMTDRRVKLLRGAYENMKVTTPEDLDLAEALLRRNHVL